MIWGSKEPVTEQKRYQLTVLAKYLTCLMREMFLFKFYMGKNKTLKMIFLI